MSTVSEQKIAQKQLGTSEGLEEGKGKTLPPPRFALEASGSEGGNVERTSEDAPKGVAEFEAMFYSIVAKGQDEHGRPLKDEATQFKFMANAACYVMDYYGWNRELIIVKVVERTGDAWGETQGNYGKEETQYIKLSKALFKQDFGLIVRTIGHEYQHAKNAIGDNPPSNKYENEFRAYYWELTDKQVIAHRNPNNIKIAIFNALRYYEYMNTDQKELYQVQYNEILSLQSKY